MENSAEVANIPSPFAAHGKLTKMDTVPTTRKCTRCGMESRLSQKQAQEVQANRLPPKYLCPSCKAAKHLQDQGAALAIFAGVGVVGLVLVCINRDFPPGWWFLNLFLFQLAIVITIVPHELGHALMARWLGFEVFEVIIGFGRKLWEGKIAGFPIIVNSIPAGGLARTSPKDTRHVRRRFFAIIAAGPFVNFVFVAVILTCADRQHLFDIEQQASLRLLPVTAFFYANLLVLLVNLWPYTHKFAVGPLPSDGKLLLTIPFWSEARVQETHLGWFLTNSAKNNQTSQTATANAWLDKAAALYHNNPHIQNGLGIRFLAEGKPAEARACFLNLLKDETAKPVVRAMFMNNVAYADLLIDDPRLLDEADRHSQEAMTWLGQSPPVKGTRGVVLLQLGRLDEALPLLLDAYAQQADWYKAENACWLAILQGRKQNAAEAQKYLAEAKKLNPKCVLLDRAERELNRPG